VIALHPLTQADLYQNLLAEKGGGIVGITRTPTAPSRWSLSYILRSHISYLTKSMFHVNPEDLMNHNEATKSRQNLIRNQRIYFSGS
jgi:hypothetical protein